MYLSKSPSFLKLIYPKLIWHKSRAEKIVYLTFDDGPIPNVTSFVLNTLKKYQIKANFFCIGDNIQKHPEIFQAIKQDGHAIGNHTFHHLNGWKTNNSLYFEDIQRCQQLTQSSLFRPPYGRIRHNQIENVLKILKNNKQDQAEAQIIMWDVLSADFDTKVSKEQCLKNVLDNTENGSIIVFHDSLKAWDRLAYSLPICIEGLLAKGFSFGLLQ